MLKITNKQIGTLECFFGIIFLALSIIAIVYTINSFDKEVSNTLQSYTSTLGFKYNVSSQISSDKTAGIGIKPGMGIESGLEKLNLSSISESQRRAFMADYVNFAISARTNVYSAIPVFVLASICALALSFIMIFQGIYHWNKEQT
jgi:hypothetical protein